MTCAPASDSSLDYLLAWPLSCLYFHNFMNVPYRPYVISGTVLPILTTMVQLKELSPNQTNLCLSSVPTWHCSPLSESLSQPALIAGMTRCKCPSTECDPPWGPGFAWASCCSSVGRRSIYLVQLKLRRMNIPFVWNRYVTFLVK